MTTCLQKYVIHHHYCICKVQRRPYPDRYKKDVGVILLLIPNTGLGEPTREISNAQLAHVKDDIQILHAV